MCFLLDLLLAIAVSIDCLTIAFTLSTISKKRKRLFMLLVSLCHFIFPFVGLLVIGMYPESMFHSMDVMSGTIFFSLGLYNLFNGFSDEEPTFVAQSVILLALMVSLDSLFVGLVVYERTLRLALMFSVMSLSFCVIGFYIGKQIEKIMGPFFYLLRGVVFIGFGAVVLFF
jgi:putative Mn2+ efflux pump MntP